MFTMRYLLCCAFVFILAFPVHTQIVERVSAPPLLIGADEGLFALGRDGMIERLYAGGSVKKIVHANGYWAVLTDEGVAVSSDCRNWEPRNKGLPVKRIKVYENGKKSFIDIVQEIKDFEVNGDMMALAVKDAVYISQDRGITWRNIGTPSERTNGIKAVAAAFMPSSSGGAPLLTVFASHPIYGVSYKYPDQRGAVWTDVNAGLENLETTGNPDEVSDIAIVVEDGKTVVFASQTFRRRLYRLDWARRRFDLLWSERGEGSGGTEDFGTIDSLAAGNGAAGNSAAGNSAVFRFVRDGAVMEAALTQVVAASPHSASFSSSPDMLAFIKAIPHNFLFTPHCFFINAGANSTGLSELWLVNEDNDPRRAAAYGKEGLYLPVNQVIDAAHFKRHLALIEDRGLDMIVIDMKDDYGRLRFTPKNGELAKKGRVFDPVDLDAFLSEMKAQGIYTVARIVAFKDPELAKKDGGRFAVWDRWNSKAWQGYYDRRVKKTDKRDPDAIVLPSSDPEYVVERTMVNEHWVDPYSEEVWAYNTDVAKELQDRGFDEIQFDYIRFPTDGDNLSAARYRWQDEGMDRDSAILSFLRHARAQIDVPISIDIYGSNGWYRTGARTGQEVELLAPYVDVICPMYYPSHFEQNFLAQRPEEMRPYRIYYIGTGRTAVIARNQVVIRPWAQAFYLNVSYDRRYYNTDYVRRQIEGVNDAGAPGYAYWNNSGRYDDIPPKKAR